MCFRSGNAGSGGRRLPRPPTRCPLTLLALSSRYVRTRAQFCTRLTRLAFGMPGQGEVSLNVCLCAAGVAACVAQKARGVSVFACKIVSWPTRRGRRRGLSLLPVHARTHTNTRAPALAQAGKQMHTRRSRLHGRRGLCGQGSKCCHARAQAPA